MPGQVVVDTNLLVAGLISGYAPATNPQSALALVRARWLLTEIAASRTQAFVPPMVVSELLHRLIAWRFEHDLPNFLVALRQRFPQKQRYTWIDLYKIRPGLLQQYAPDLTAVLQALARARFVVLQPGSLPPGQGAAWEDELIRLVKRYELDTNDAGILMDARRVGIFSIITLDLDLRRASNDFDIYTWL